MYLGDGYICRSRRTYRLHVSLHQERIIERVASAITALRPGHPIGFSSTRCRRDRQRLFQRLADSVPTARRRSKARATDRTRAVATEHREAARGGLGARVYRIGRVPTQTRCVGPYLPRLLVYESLGGYPPAVFMVVRPDRAASSPSESSDSVACATPRRRHARPTLGSRPAGAEGREH